MEYGGVVDDDIGDSGSMICSDHPFKTNNKNNPGAICAFCLQEKLGKLVSSSFPITVFPSSSSSFKSDGVFGSATSNVVGSYSHKNGVISSSTYNNGGGISRKEYQYHSRRARFNPFLVSQRKKKKEVLSLSSTMVDVSDLNKNVRLNRSKSTNTPRCSQFLDMDREDFIPPKRRFWSFLHHTKSTKTATELPQKVIDKPSRDLSSSVIPEKEEYSPNSHGSTEASSSSFERKVSRSRSVGCGSRSFSGDFFERISTGFGDCTLRRVESQREGKSKHPPSAAITAVVRGEHHHCTKERVKCGGIFGGFIMTSSSSTSSSSSYRVSSSTEETTGKMTAITGTGSGTGVVVHGRSRTWGWAFNSPIRAFSKPSSSSSKDGKSINNKSTAPNLSALSVQNVVAT